MASVAKMAEFTIKRAAHIGRRDSTATDTVGSDDTEMGAVQTAYRHTAPSAHTSRIDQRYGSRVGEHWSKSADGKH